MIKYNKNDVYKTKYFMYQYNDTNFRILKQKYCRERGFELIEKTKHIVKKTDEEEIRRISLSRSKSFIRSICLANSFCYFVTLTVNKNYCDRYDIDLCQSHLKNILHNYQRICKRQAQDFKYILVTEKHKDGAFHFHGLMKRIRRTLYKCSRLFILQIF